MDTWVRNYITYLCVNKDNRSALVIFIAYTILYTSTDIMLRALSPVSTDLL